MVDAATTEKAAQLCRGAPVRRRIRVGGTVQGMGFRPFVFREATARGLAGWVANSSEGVILEAEGGAAAIDGLVEAIRAAPPAHARVASLRIDDVAPRGEPVFAIRASALSGPRAAQILPDLASCDDCLAEMRDPTDRRYRYPFINCTQCGPRYSIVEAVPYDRARTSMRQFGMCDACRAEYEDPASRRFHAEPTACPECGPHLALWNPSADVLARNDAALHMAAEAVRDGGIVAVKGIGGFHLFVDARDDDAVRLLRHRKQRDEKPFAVMFPMLSDIADCCRVGAAETELLTGSVRPVVLLHRSGGPIAPSVAPGLTRLGVMLPYTPLHHLLMEALGFPVVATSGNVSDEPIVTDEHEALERLRGIADLFLVHDRPIVRAVDDSVAQVVCDAPQLLRRARGYAPAPVTESTGRDGIVAFGGHLKATVALTTTGAVVASQHLGDLETVTARAGYRRALDDIVRLHEVRPRVAVCDLHPDYASGRAAEHSGLPLKRVQHHVAHVAAAMAEHGLIPPALGIAWDGAGYGPDGTLWGGEFLLLSPAGWRRVAHLRSFPLPGGEAAVREPRRAALGLMFAAYGDAAFEMTDLAPVAAFPAAERKVLRTMLLRGINSPVTTSAGRLFDAYAALCGLRQHAGYEGQGAAMFEAAMDGSDSCRAYDMPLIENGNAPMVVDWEPALAAALADLRHGTGAAPVSAALHKGLAAAVAAVAVRIGQPKVVLTGGCFQNVRLTEATVAALANVGLTPYWHRTVPPNDGGLAVGQATWTMWQEMREQN